MTRTRNRTGNAFLTQTGGIAVLARLRIAHRRRANARRNCRESGQNCPTVAFGRFSKTVFCAETYGVFCAGKLGSFFDVFCALPSARRAGNRHRGKRNSDGWCRADHYASSKMASEFVGALVHRFRRASAGDTRGAQRAPRIFSEISPIGCDGAQTQSFSEFFAINRAARCSPRSGRQCDITSRFR